MSFGKKLLEKSKEIGKKAADASKGVAGKMSAASAATKEAKAPVEGALERYGVVYLGGLVAYPKKLDGEIGFNILPDSFYFKSTKHVDFAEMEIPYDSITKFEITTRTVSTAEALLADNSKDLEVDNNIEITYNVDDTEVLLRLEMLTGVTVNGQAVKCKEMVDFLRQQKIYGRLNKAAAPAAAPVVDIAEQIQKLSGLKDAGILTQEEFDTKKAELLAKM